MAREIPVTQAREELADLVNRVAYGTERILLTRHGRPVAALVPLRDLSALEQAEAGAAARHAEPVRLSSVDDAGGAPAGTAQPASPAAPLRIAAEHSDRPRL